jgi:eukaryotic-like serine/threonine-protein kinase
MKPGTEIGNYVLSELLDQRGAGEVWLAYRELEAGGRTAVAIKFPHGAGVLDPRVRDGLDDEARLRMQLQHSNIPRVIDLGLHEGLPYFVMDYIAGRSLAELLERLRDTGTPLRFELVAHIAREVGYALRYAHGFELDGVSRPVLHRDVAPKSVLLSRQGAVYVVGFGVSEAAGITSSSSPAKGTLLYMAPEHALGFPTPKSDGWGLGSIMWEMIEGRPFRAEVEADDLRRAAKQGRHGALTREGIPEVLRVVTEGLLQVDDRERLTLDEALRQLEAPDLPVQRMALADVLERGFGDALHRAGRSRTDAPETPDALPAAKVIRDDGPFGLDAWRVDPEDDDALPPPPAWASMDDRAVDAGAEPEQPSSGARAAEDVRAADDEAHEEPRPTTSDAAAEPPMLAVLDLGESSSAVQRPVVPPALDPPPPTPAAPPRKRRSPALLLPVVGLAVASLAWVAWPEGTAHEATPMASPTVPRVTVAEAHPVVEAEPQGPQLAVGPPDPEPAPPDVPEPATSEVPEPATSDAAPVPEPATSDAAPVPEPGPTVEPSPGHDSPHAGKPTAGSKPPRKQTAGPPVPLAIELLLFADMEVEVNGVHFSLGVRKTSAKTSVRPGTVRVRWRRPLGKWKSKTFEVQAGARYELRLDDRGPSLKKTQ